jgi:adenosine deaminase
MTNVSYSNLHCHLDGSMRWETFQLLANQLDMKIPSQVREILFYKDMGLHAALDKFHMTLATLQDPMHVKRVAAEICEDALLDHVTTLEIRFAPQLHKGGSLADIIDAALEGIAGRAGLILCGLYGENPNVLEALVDLAIPRPGVVGIDLAGGPLPSHHWQLIEYSPAFTKAMQADLGRTVHAGEGRPAYEIKQAILHLHAQRIGHGVSLLDDSELIDLILERNVTIEACPTSNLHTGVIASIGDHPLSKWIELGIQSTINPDNILFSDVNASSEHDRSLHINGMTQLLVQQCIEWGHQAAFSR